MPESILITGANRGIGLALAEEFAREGHTVFAGSRSPAAPSLGVLREIFANVHEIRIDVTSDESVAAAAASVSALVPSLDILVNNAAVFPGEGNETLAELDLAWFGEAFETNVVGVARVIRAFHGMLGRSSRPRIANISSGAASISTKDDADYYPYGVSKAALNMLTRTIAAGFRADGIVVTAISPGWVRTEMGGDSAPLGPGESAASLAKTISSLSLSESGLFLGRDGDRNSYHW